MKNSLILFLLISTVTGYAQRQKATSVINASLNKTTRSIDGELTTTYTNHSPDTLHFIWFTIWPNAFRNDRTAFSEYLINTKKRTDFYFAPPEKRGYINRLAFHANNKPLPTEDHPQFIDLVKVLLNEPLIPGDSVKISTPFHVQIPFLFEKFGYDNAGFFLSHWYPAPAPYLPGDNNSWRWITEPYVDGELQHTVTQHFKVTIKVPPGYSYSSNAILTDSSRRDSLHVLTFTASDAPDIAISIQKKNASPSLESKTAFSTFACQTISRLFSRKLLPAAGYNEYDGLQAGVLFQNMMDDSAGLRYVMAPLYAFNSKKVNGIADVSYSFSTTTVGISAATFSTFDGADSTGRKVFAGMYKLSPYVKLKLPAKSPDIQKTVAYRLFVIGENNLTYVPYSGGNLFYAAEGKTKTRYLNQISFNIITSRILYPYAAEIQAQQTKDFYRLNVTGKYFFNYANGGGLRMRLFAAAFGYLGAPSASEKFELTRYQPKLTAVRGDEDYTYSNYFIARNNFTSFPNQIMMRDGGLKLRTDLFDGLQGRSEKWITSINVSTTLPQITPVALPLRLFADAGTYSEAWDREKNQPRFLYVAGLQFSLFNELLHIYAPLLYSSYFRDQLKTVPEENKFLKRVSFSIDLQHADIKKAFCTKSLH